MLGYHLGLALRSLRHNKVLTALMILTLGLGIGASITTLTVMKLLSSDPLPGKSNRLIYPQLDPRGEEGYIAGTTTPPDGLTYIDAMNLMRARKGKRQTLVSVWGHTVKPDRGDQPAFLADAVRTTADFFPMFDVPFRYGSGWSEADDDNAAPVVVISDFLNNQLFDGANSVGKSVHIRDNFFRVVGVLRPWSPQPRFYGVQQLGNRSYGVGDALFFPVETARSTGLANPSLTCKSNDPASPENADCPWLSMWVELPAATDGGGYKAYLADYARDQVAAGRFKRTDVDAPVLMDWLRSEKIVPDDARQQTFLAFGFLLICVVNTVGLLLAKCLRRSREVGVRRALGATKATIFQQFIVESAIVGLAGGTLGLLFAVLGLWFVRQQPAPYASFVHLDLGMFSVTFLIALIASLLAGVLPAWRACVLAPAPYLKSQ